MSKIVASVPYVKAPVIVDRIVDPVLIRQWVPGVPVAQPRPRARAFRMGQFTRVQMYDAGTSDEWKATIVKALLKARPLAAWEGPFRLDLVFHMPRPACRNRKKDPDGAIPHTSKPDVDNLFKAVADCLVAGKFIADDAPIVSMSVEKYYAAKGVQPGMFLLLARWTETPGMVHMEVG